MTQLKSPETLSYWGRYQKTQDAKRVDAEPAPVQLVITKPTTLKLNKLFAHKFIR